MEELMIVANVAIIFGVIYKLFELFAGRRERMMLIEKMPAELLADGKLKGADFSSLPLISNINKFTALRFGMLFLGLGAGLLLGYLIISTSHPEFLGDDASRRVDSLASVIWGASVLVGGGVGLLLSFIVEVIITSKNK